MSRGALASLALVAMTAPLLGGFVSCHRHVEAARSEMDAAWDRLAAFDEARRTKTDFAKLATWDRLSGPDPYAIRALPGAAAFAGVLRGSDALVVVNTSLREVQRLEAPRGAVGLAVSEDGTVFVAGELATALARYRWKDGVLTPSGTFELDGVRAIRDVATGPNGWTYVVEEERGRLHAFRIERAKGVERVGPITEI
jgi:hypothetical protein